MLALNDAVEAARAWITELVVRRELSAFSRWADIPYDWLIDVKSGSADNPTIIKLQRLIEAANRWDLRYGRMPRL